VIIVSRQHKWHKDIKTPLEFYDQVTAEDRTEAASAIDRLPAETDAGLTPEGDFGQNSGQEQF